VHGRGLCDKHWARWHKHGDPSVRLTRESGTGHKRPDGYIAIVVDGRPWLQHRYVWTCAYGPIPPKYQVHHRNGVRDDNRIENLELIHIARHGQMHSLARPPFRHSPETIEKLRAIAKARKGTRRTFCKVPGCDRPTASWRLCNKHYLSARYHGELLPTRRRPNAS